MTRFTPLRSAASVIALLCATTANADVTATEVWADWQESLGMYGKDGVTIGDEKMEGDTLTVSGISLSTKDNMTTVTAEMGDLMFTELGDGTVSITMAPSYPITITGDNGDIIRITVSQSGLKMIVSGTEAAMDYDISADQYAFAVDEIMQDGAPVKADIRLIANDLTGSYTAKTGEMRQITYDISAASLDMLADITPPETAGDYVTFSGKIMDLSTKADMTMPLADAIDAPGDMFADGFAMLAGYEYTGSNYIFDLTSQGEQTSGTASTGAGTLAVKMDEAAMSYDSAVADLAVAINGAAIPSPIEISMAQYGFGINMPVAKTEEPADFGLRLNLIDLAVNDTTWMLADPTSSLPHDPATIVLDLSGKATMLVDMLDPTQTDISETDPAPAELNAITINDLRLTALGANIAAKGDFTFDNTDKVTFDGMPRPMGDMTIDLNGANGLIENLIKMGVIPAETAMWGQMAVGMFAKSTGDDALTSNIVIDAQGNITANGQMLPKF